MFGIYGRVLKRFVNDNSKPSLPRFFLHCGEIGQERRATWRSLGRGQDAVASRKYFSCGESVTCHGGRKSPLFYVQFGCLSRFEAYLRGRGASVKLPWRFAVPGKNRLWKRWGRFGSKLRLWLVRDWNDRFLGVGIWSRFKEGKKSIGVFFEEKEKRGLTCELWCVMCDISEVGKAVCPRAACR